MFICSIEKKLLYNFLLNNFISFYLLFHNINQNDNFSGKIKQKAFSEVIQLQVIQYYSNKVTSNTVLLLQVKQCYSNTVIKLQVVQCFICFATTYYKTP